MKNRTWALLFLIWGLFFVGALCGFSFRELLLEKEVIEFNKMKYGYEIMEAKNVGTKKL